MFSGAGDASARGVTTPSCDGRASARSLPAVGHQAARQTV